MTTNSWTQDAESGWRDYYRARLVEPQEAVSHISSGHHIWISVGQQVSMLVTALLGRADELRDVRISTLPAADFGWFSDEFRGKIDINVLWASLFARDAVNEGKADFTPWMVYGGQKANDEGRVEARPVDVSLLSVTPPNQWGYVCLGASLWDAKTTASRANLVIAEVNQNIPRTYGDTWMHVSEIDWFIENTPPPPETGWLYPEPDPWDRPIADYVASLVNHGDTIQMGTGSTTGNIPRFGVLDDKEDLGYFAELTVPGTVELVKKGVITSKYLEQHPGKFVTTTAGNDPSDMQFINDNPMFEFYPVEYMHHPGVIGQIDNLIAINNALSIDLTGQIAAANLGHRVWSGTGGHLSYAMGAFMSNGGRYVCVMPATARKGAVSRIVPLFERGQVVTVPRDIADTVVTEYGIARLLNRTIRERAEELIAIAHPDFRAELRAEAQKLNIL